MSKREARVVRKCLDRLEAEFVKHLPEKADKEWCRSAEQASHFAAGRGFILMDVCRAILKEHEEFGGYQPKGIALLKKLATEHRLQYDGWRLRLGDELLDAYRVIRENSAFTIRELRNDFRTVFGLLKMFLRCENLGDLASAGMAALPIVLDRDPKFSNEHHEDCMCSVCCFAWKLCEEDED